MILHKLTLCTNKSEKAGNDIINILPIQGYGKYTTWFPDVVLLFVLISWLL